MKMICFPHAGGLASYYNFLKKISGVDVILYEYSGRASKVNEINYESFQNAVERISEDMNQKISTDEYVIFGHSMGAYIAYEVAYMMQNRYQKPAKILFISGQAAPNRYKKVDIINDDEKFMFYISRLGGIEKEVIDNIELSNLFFSIIRKDFELYNTYIPTHKVLNTPIGTLFGGEDMAFETKYIDDWKMFSQKYLGSKQFKGDHFYFNKNKEEIIGYFENKIG